jgi:7-cyano-7-deazaguanine synthase in queuosine biosynthesis
MSHDKVFLIGDPDTCNAEYDESIRVAGYGTETNSDHQIEYHRNTLKQFYGKNPPTIIEDLLKVAFGMFAADCATGRPKPADSGKDEFRKFSRRIKLIVQVKKLPKWKASKEMLEKTLSFMTYDKIDVEFRQDQMKTETRQEKVTNSKFDMVSLFSGGLDSLGGAYKLKEENNPLFLSLVSGNGEVLNNLEDITDFDIERVRVNRSIGEEDNEKSQSEESQFSRSFSYLSLGIALAYSQDIDTVAIPENGVVARQIGLNKGRKPTRTVHPKFLSYYQDFVNSILDLDMNIVNPLDNKTKSEVIDLIQDEKAVTRAYSCSHTRFGFWEDEEAGKKQHCGMGIPCLFRTVGLVGGRFSGIDEKLNLAFNPFEIDFEDPSKYQNAENPNEQPIRNHYRDGVSGVLEMTQLAYELLNSERDDLITTYPQLSQDEVYKMYLRFAENVKETAEFFDNEEAKMTVADKFK